MERNWTTTGEELVERLGRDSVEQEIDGMEWQEVPENGSLTTGFMQGAAVNAVIRELRISKVSAVAFSSFSRPSTSEREDGFYPGFYGIEGNYANGRARVYVLDVGTYIQPLVSDFWPKVRRGGDGLMTRREKLEKRAERRRVWAESAAAKADSAQAGVHRIADGIPFGQPILVGHHSEGRARRDQARMHSGMAKSVDESRKAERHVQAADGIERQLATSVFSDDADAVERLTEIVAELEAKRDRMKAENDAFRKDPDNKAALKQMTPYERSQAIPYPAYSLSNLGATIRQKKQRIDQLARERAVVEAGGRGPGRHMESRYAGVCADCGGAIARGSRIVWYRLTKEAVHADFVDGILSASCPAVADA